MNLCHSSFTLIILLCENRSLPRKTPITVLLFVGLICLPLVVPALQDYKSLNPQDIPLVWTFPMPKAVTNAVEARSAEWVRLKQQEVTAPRNLSDPKHELDHFYSALLHGGNV